ncbi:MAG TPA: hypothetical protein VIH87_00825 [Methylocella sp.]
MRELLRKKRIAVAIVAGLVPAACEKKESEPTPPEVVRPVPPPRPEVQFKPVKGVSEAVKEASLVTQALPQLRSRLDIRTIIVVAGEPVTLPVENEGIFEVRAGTLVTIEDGKPRPHQRGEMWQVENGSRVTLQASGELAVVRAIYLVPGEK